MGIFSATRSEQDAQRLTHELERVTDERDAALARLSEQEQLSTLALLASGVAHEVNNPLQGILTYAQLLEEVLPSQSAERGYAHHIVGACDHIRGVLAEVLQVARNTHEPAQSVDPVTLVYEACELMQASLHEERIHVEFHPGAITSTVQGRERQLTQVLTNLIMNARDAMRELPRDRQRRLTLRLTQRDGHVHIDVDDTGPGIAPERLPHIFDAFYSSKVHGTGLGLAICRNIVQHHGGSIYAESLLPIGARVAISLPAVEGLAPRTPRRANLARLGEDAFPPGRIPRRSTGVYATYDDSVYATYDDEDTPTGASPR